MPTDGGGPDHAADPRAGAIARFQAFASALEHVGLEDFRQVALGVGDAPARAGWRAAAAEMAADHGLDDVLQAARSAVREHVGRVYASGLYRPTWAGLNWGLSTGSATDQAAAIEAAEDAVTAAIVEPYAHDEILEGLRGPYELIVSAHPTPAAAGDMPPVVAEGARGVPGPLILVLGILAVVALAVGGWPFVVVPVLVLAAVRRLRG